MGNYSFIIMIVFFIGLMFFSTRQQRKQAQKRQEELASLAKGTEVITIGGMYAVVDEVDSAANKVVLDVDGVYLTFELSAIKRILPAAVATEAPVESAEDTSAVEEA